jgi:hypothetical protein
MNFVYLRSSRLHIFKSEPWFMHWQQGGERKVEKSCIALGCIFSFLAFGGVVCCTKAVWPVFATGLTGFWWNRSDRFWELAWPVCAQSCHLFRGSMHMCRGSSCMLWWFVLFSWAWFYLWCVEPLPLPEGSETCLLQVILIYAFLRLSIACWGFFSFVSFLFSVSLITIFVCCQCTHQGKDWGQWVVQGPVDVTSGVMSDWQRWVDWSLAKYCRCRLRLDSCWCKWRKSVKGRSLWGLQVWRRQVCFVRGTRWPVGSTASRMVARTARWSWWTVSWLSHKTKVEPGLRGSQVMSGDWRRLHQVSGVYGGSLENYRVTRLSHLTFRRKPSAYLYACQDQVSCI